MYTYIYKDTVEQRSGVPALTTSDKALCNARLFDLHWPLGSEAEAKNSSQNGLCDFSIEPRGV